MANIELKTPQSSSIRYICSSNRFTLWEAQFRNKSYYEDDEDVSLDNVSRRRLRCRLKYDISLRRLDLTMQIYFSVTFVLFCFVNCLRFF